MSTTTQDNPHSKNLNHEQNLKDLHSLIKRVSKKLVNSDLTDDSGNVMTIAIKSSTSSDEYLEIVDPEAINQLQTALDNPEDLQGSVKISMNGERVLLVQDGKIIDDPYKIINPIEKQINEVFEQNSRDQGRDLLKYIFVMLSVVGQKQADGWLSYEDEYYTYMEKEGRISVISKESKGEILNNSGFTNLADQSDMVTIGLIGKLTEKFCSQSPQQRPSLKP